MQLDFSSLNLDGAEAVLAAEIVKRDGSLYKSRPKNASGEAQYLWRMVAFALGTGSVNCMPVCADFYLPEEVQSSYRDPEEVRDRKHAAKDAMMKWLDDLAERLIRTVPVTQQPGTMRWARAFGAV